VNLKLKEWYFELHIAAVSVTYRSSEIKRDSSGRAKEGVWGEQKNGEKWEGCE